MDAIDNMTEEMLGSIEAEVDRLAAIEAIQRLRLTYYSQVNESRFDDLPSLFTPNARVDFGNELGCHQGSEAISAALAKMGGSLFVKLLPHGHVADISGDTAEGHLFVEGRLIVAGEAFITMGKISDHYVRDGEGWLISSSQAHYYFAVPLHAGWAVEDSLRPFTSP